MLNCQKNREYQFLDLPNNLLKLFEKCNLCPRQCGVNRLNLRPSGPKGYCGESAGLRVGYIGPHFGEEPPLTGTNGSGTVFFSGCSLQCRFCQNYQISRDNLGTLVSMDALLLKVTEMIGAHQVHNLNLVTPDHFFPYVFHLVERLRQNGLRLPVVLNCSGYQSVEMLTMLEDFCDIYLPDYKYADPELARRLSNCPDYPQIALDAISVMVKQKGFLDAQADADRIATKGVLIRHLILPGKIQNSLDALTTLFLEFGPRLPLSLMSQYRPVLTQKDPDLNRPLTHAEFDQVYQHALDLGFEHLFVQFPEEKKADNEAPFLPDFRREKPFCGPVK
ncbi:MAG: radical SAM protein [Desulfobacteraceae bacterium]|nr:MAG: radical SAM protein [Desulfobacteraceae bacterium]